MSLLICWCVRTVFLIVTIGDRMAASQQVLVTSGLGGMSGAQAKAAVICRCIAVIAEVNRKAIDKRHSQGWLLEVIDNLDSLVAMIRLARTQRRPVSIGYHGNVVDVW